MAAESAGLPIARAFTACASFAATELYLDSRADHHPCAAALAALASALAAGFLRLPTLRAVAPSRRRERNDPDQASGQRSTSAIALPNMELAGADAGVTTTSRERIMIGRKILSAATLLGLATLGAAAKGDSGAENSPPSVTLSETTVGGKPALCVDVVDPDGAADLLSFGFEYTLDTGIVYKNTLAITLWVYGKKGMSSSDIEDGKRVCFTKLPGNVVSLKVTAMDFDWHQVIASAAVPSSITAGQPKFGVVKAPPKKK